MHLDINRRSTGPQGTPSIVIVRTAPEGEQVATFSGIEQPWQDNRPFHSCIPAGEYRLEEHRGEKGHVWALVGGTVAHQESPGSPATRFACLIHAANRSRELQGCLAIGRRAGQDADGTPYVIDSRKAIEQLRELAPPELPHTATIRWT